MKEGMVIVVNEFDHDDKEWLTVGVIDDEDNLDQLLKDYYGEDILEDTKLEHDDPNLFDKRKLKIKAMPDWDDDYEVTVYAQYFKLNVV